MSALVSILIPAYDSEKWIRFTIESALSQSWPNKEIIIVNDGSKDNTLQIAKQFESKIVKVVTQENMGASSARNKALSLAQGDYIQWLDSDDLLASNKISEQMKFAENGQSSLTCLTSSYGIFYWRTEKARFFTSSLCQNLTPVEWLIVKYSTNDWIIPAAWLVNRRLTEKAGLWDERLSRNDDDEYFSRIVALSEFIKFVPVKGTYYRQSGYSQLSRSISENALNSMILSKTLCIRYLLSLEDSERTRRACIKMLQLCTPLLSFRGTKMYDRLNDLVVELNGELKKPRFGLKYDILYFLCGDKTANKILSIGRKFKLLTKIKLDEILYRMNRKNDEGIKIIH